MASLNSHRKSMSVGLLNKKADERTQQQSQTTANLRQQLNIRY